MRGYIHQAYYESLDSINPGSTEQSSDFMVKIKQETVADICNLVIPAKIKEFGAHRFGWLEIHSHGEPGRILLGSDGVSAANVQAFGTALRSYMKPNATIEVMACEVAGGKIKSSPRFEMQMDIKRIAMGVTRGMSKNDPRMAKYMNAVYETIYHDPSLRQQHPGMMLCCQLASSSGCRVRAGCWIQVEEDSRSAADLSKRQQAGYRRRYGTKTYSSSPVLTMPRQYSDGSEYDARMYTEFGHWEGPVYEFLPGGGLNYLGDGLNRYLPYRVLHTGSSNMA